MHLVVPPGGSFREPRRVELGPGVLTIGRGANCEVRIDVPGVDDEHAKISELALVAVGADCAVGDVPLDAGQKRLVMPGDEIQIGSVVVSLDGSDPTLPPGQARAVPRIRVVEGQNSGAELVLAKENHEYVIGRSPKADLRLEDREVSREHLKVVRRGISIFLFDQASTRGSWLGRSAVYQGTRIEWDRPRMLKVGATVLSLDLPDDGRRARPVGMPVPMTPPPRVRADKPAAPAPVVDVGPPPAGIVAYHYEAKALAPDAAAVPSQLGAPLPTMGVPGEPVAPHPVSAPSVPPAYPSAPPPAYPSAPPAYPSVPPGMPSVPPPSSFQPNARGSRTAWKKTGPTIGRMSGLLLLALAGLAILGALFVVFSLME